MSAPGFIVALAATLREIVRPLEEALDSPAEFAVLLREHGWHIEGDAAPAVETFGGRLRLADRLPPLEQAIGELIATGSLTAEEASTVLDAAIDLLSAIRSLAAMSPPAGAPAPLDRPEFWTTFPLDLAQTLVVDYLELRQPPLFAVLHLIGVIDQRDIAADATPGRVSYTKTELHWERLGETLSDPAAVMREVYGWGTALDHDKLTGHLQRAMYAFGIPARRGFARHPLVDAFYAPANPARETLRDVRVPFVITQDGGVRAELGATLLPIPPAGDPGGAPNGVLIGPYAEGEFGLTVPLGGLFELEFKGGLEADAAVGVEIRPGAVAPRLSTTAATLDAAATLTAAPFEPWVPVGDRDGDRLEVHDLALSLEMIGEVTDPEVRVRLGTTRAELTLDFSDADGFQRKLLGSGTQTFAAALALVWSSKHGLTFEGSGSLAVDIPLNVSIGSVKLASLSLAIAHKEDTTTVAAGVTASASLGGFGVVVQGVGAALRLRHLAPGEPSANLGDLEVSFGFKPPDGLGVTADVAGVRGGGFLRIGPEAGEYAGALELVFGEIGIKAIGDLADRPEGWSLLLLLYTNFPAIQLPYGFTLNGLGGMIGVQHGVDIDALIAGIKTGAFDDVLFPSDPVTNAPRIIERLRTLFPRRLHALTVAPMVDIGWGRPRRLLFARLAFVLQFDNALGTDAGTAVSRVVLLGTLRLAIGPRQEDPDATVVKLIVDVLGFWDRDRHRYGFLSRLRDSTIAGIDIIGGLGVFGEYGDHSRFLLAAGGFNPRFQDVPAEMSSTLDRLGAAFSIGRFSVKLVGYFALTPGTIQAGADLSARGKFGSVGVTGSIGFDAIVYLEPRTHFIIDFRVSAEITYKGHTLTGVKVAGTLEGPGLWTITGKVTFSILWWDISKSFDESWGDEALIEAIATDVTALLDAELHRAANWSAQLPQAGGAMVTLAPPPGELATLAHPLGRFVFAQRVAPLGVTLDRFGAGPISGANRFDIVGVTVAEVLLPERTIVTEHFARAQFIDMTEEDRLTRPSFEALDAGVEFASTGFHVPAAGVPADLEYEPTAYIEVPGGITTRDETTTHAGLDHAVVAILSRHGAAGRAPLRVHERLAARTSARVTLLPPTLAVVERGSFEPSAGDALHDRARRSALVAEQRLAGRAGGPPVQLVEAFEVIGA